MHRATSVIRFERGVRVREVPLRRKPDPLEWDYVATVRLRGLNRVCAGKAVEEIMDGDVMNGAGGVSHRSEAARRRHHGQRSAATPLGGSVGAAAKERPNYERHRKKSPR